MRYALGKFDENLVTTSYSEFNEDQLVILNVVNWLFLSRNSETPFHSLFFKEGKKLPSIVAEIK